MMGVLAWWAIALCGAFLLVLSPICCYVPPTSPYDAYDHFFVSSCSSPAATGTTWTATATAFTLEFFWGGACQIGYSQYADEGGPSGGRGYYIALPGPDFSHSWGGTCSKCVKVHNPATGRTIEAVVVDKCVAGGCSESSGAPSVSWANVDLTAGAFAYLANLETSYWAWRNPFVNWLTTTWPGPGMPSYTDYPGGIWGAGSGSMSVQLEPVYCALSSVDNSNVRLKVKSKGADYIELVVKKTVLPVGMIHLKAGSIEFDMVYEPLYNVFHNPPGQGVPWDSYVGQIVLSLIPVRRTDLFHVVSGVTFPTGLVPTGTVLPDIDLGFQFPSLSPDVCSPPCVNGNCVTGSCSCNSGWSGSSCDDPICGGTPECSGHGSCSSPDTCVCTSGWSGSVCADASCGGVLSGDPGVCSGHGTCDGPNTCNCESTHHGETCSHEIFPGVECFGVASSNPTVCSSRGSCVDDDVCQCDTGYTDTDCGLVVTCWSISHFNTSHVCSGQGTCTATDQCQCNVGFSGSACAASLVSIDGDGDGDGLSSVEVSLVVVGVVIGVAVMVLVVVGIIVGVSCAVRKKAANAANASAGGKSQDFGLDDADARYVEMSDGMTKRLQKGNLLGSNQPKNVPVRPPQQRQRHPLPSSRAAAPPPPPPPATRHRPPWRPERDNRSSPSPAFPSRPVPASRPPPAPARVPVRARGGRFGPRSGLRKAAPPPPPPPPPARSARRGRGGSSRGGARGFGHGRGRRPPAPPRRW